MLAECCANNKPQLNHGHSAHRNGTNGKSTPSDRLSAMHPASHFISWRWPAEKTMIEETSSTALLGERQEKFVIAGNRDEQFILQA